MRKYTFLLLVVAATVAISCQKSDKELLVGRWKLIQETIYKSDTIAEEKEYPFEGNTSVFVFEKDGSYRYTEVIASKVKVTNGTYSLDEPKHLTTEDGIAGEIVNIQKKKLIVDVDSSEIRIRQRVFERMK